MPENENTSTSLLKNTRHSPSLNRILTHVLDVWPAHERYLSAALLADDSCDLNRVEEVARLILLLGEDRLSEWASDYKWLCERFKEEQMHFFRHKQYRLSSLQEAIEQVYNNDAFMSRYMNAVLFTQLFWKNHALSMDLFRTQFIPEAQEGYDYLEVGPGHGLFMAFVAMDDRCNSLTGWDLSATSLKDTRAALEKMHTQDADKIQLEQNDIVSATDISQRFDCIMCSEVLEHTEKPEEALANLYGLLRDQGRIYLNIPVNSPAPDHIYLWTECEEVLNAVKEAGFEIEYSLELPPTGKTLETARRQGLDISCIIIGRRC